MSVFERISRVVRVNLNDMVSQSPNPEEVLNQAINDIQEALVQTRQAIARIDTIPKQKAQLNYTAAVIEAQKCQQLAQKAHDRGDKNLENRALERLKIHQDNANKAKAKMDEQIEQESTLKQNLSILETKLIEAKTERDLLKSRTVMAKANQLQNTIKASRDTNTMGASEKIEEKALEVVAHPHVLKEPFSTLEFDDDVDDELQKMKQPLMLPNNFKEKPKEILILENVIQDTRKVIANAVANQRQIHNQHVQAKAEVSTFHKQALQAALKGDQTSAMQALLGEAAQEKLADIIKPQIEQQEALIDILKQNLAAIEGVMIMVKKLTDVEQNECDNNLEQLQEQLDNL